MGTVLKALAVSALAVSFFFLGSSHASASSEVSSDGDERSQQVYIVYMGHQHEPSSELPAGGFSAAKAAHHGLLNQVLDDGSDATDRIVYSYTRTMNGFAARLTEEERQKLSSKEGVVSVFPSRTYQLQITRSWDFLGFPQTARRSLPTEADVIVGMIDTGVWPHSPSFSDAGFGPPPSRWKGACLNYTCNNKIIGARAYRQGTTTGLSPVDTVGHGTHTASTAAGRVVANVTFGGLAAGAGTARGAVPGARLAVYKACWEDSCRGEDVLAAFDDAVADGVDVVSYSIGGTLPHRYFEDVAAIGAFHGMRRGVLTSAAASNSALEGGYVYNVAPWMLSVAASSTDRRLVDRLVLGNGNTIVGASVNIFPRLEKAPLVLPMNINGSCRAESLAGQSYKGKILLCAGGSDGTGPLLAGAAGAVIVSSETDVAYVLPLPALIVSQDQFDRIMAYVNKTRHPVGTIRGTETAFDSKAPVVASFSSRGPNLISPGILKPDLSAPGVDILAAWTPLSPVTGNVFGAYNILSGTSMACPHATGVAAYVKSFHPDWSPAMIMSALITTATPMNQTLNPGGGELVYGAGQLNPTRALNPGLVYDAREDDYVRMLCAEGYNSTQLSAVTGSNATSCHSSNGKNGKGTTTGTAAELNYPTMAHKARPGKNFTVHFPRAVTYVGAPEGAVYTAEVVGGSGPYVRVAVTPRRLAFSRLLQKLAFTVTVSGAVPDAYEFVSAAVVWSDGVRQVRSPIIVHTVDVKYSGGY